MDCGTFWEVHSLPDTKRTTVVHKIKAHCACKGTADVPISDNRHRRRSKNSDKSGDLNCERPELDTHKVGRDSKMPQAERCSSRTGS